MKNWFTRLLSVGLSTLLVLFLMTSCSSPGPQGPPSSGSDQSPSHSKEAPSSTDSADEPFSLPQGLVSIDEVAAAEPVSSNSAPQLPATFRDATGKTVEIKDTSRVLALDIYGTLAEIVIALDQKDTLVGRTVSNTQKELAKLPNVTVGGHQLNAEAILNLRPTLVIADKTLGPPEVMQQLESAGTTVVYVDAKRSLKKMPKMIKDVATIMGVPDRGEELAKKVQQRVKDVSERIQARAPQGKDKPSGVFLYIRGTGGVFFIFGKGSGADDLIPSLGLRDIASEKNISDIKPATAEALAELQPDVIFVMTKGLESGGGLQGLLQRPGVAQTPAGKNKAIVAIPDGQSLSFGPSYPDMLERITEQAFSKKK